VILHAVSTLQTCRIFALFSLEGHFAQQFCTINAQIEKLELFHTSQHNALKSKTLRYNWLHTKNKERLWGFFKSTER